MFENQNSSNKNNLNDDSSGFSPQKINSDLSGQSVNPKSGVEDIFEKQKTETISMDGNPKSFSPSDQLNKSQLPVEEENSMAVNSGRPSNQKEPIMSNTKNKIKLLLIIFGMAFGVAVLAGGGWFLYIKLFSGSEMVNESVGENNSTNNLLNENYNNNLNLNNSNINVDENLNYNNNINLNTNIKGTKDSDFDGLSDVEEASLGTNPESADTDKDGLLDKEEIETYKTNPTNHDSDGDGYDDGVEVKGGYNPLGEGKLPLLNDVK